MVHAGFTGREMVCEFNGFDFTRREFLHVITREIFFATTYFPLGRRTIKPSFFSNKTRYIWRVKIKIEESCLQVSVSYTLSVNILAFVGKVHTNFFSSKHRGRAEQNKQDAIPEGFKQDLSFPVNAFPTVRLARKLLLVVGGVLLIAPRAATVLHCSTIRPTPAHLLNREG